MPSTADDAQTFLDHRPFGRPQLLVATLCGFIAMIDDLRISRAALGPVLAAGLVGMVAGLASFAMLPRLTREPGIE